MKVALDGRTCEVVSSLGDNDVLLGRGTGPNENLGNIRFRSLVAKLLSNASDNSSEYRKMTKEQLARIVFESVKERKGKFLRKLDKGEIDVLRPRVADTKVKASKEDKANLYITVSDHIAMDKTKQSFRHQLRVLQQSQTANDSKLKDADERLGASKEVERMTPKNLQMKAMFPRTKRKPRQSKFHECLVSREQSSNATSAFPYYMPQPINSFLFSLAHKQQVQSMIALENERRMASLALMLRLKDQK